MKPLIAFSGKNESSDSTALTSLAQEIQVIGRNALRRDRSGRMMAAAVPFEEVKFKRSIRVTMLATAAIVVLAIAGICAQTVSEITATEGAITPSGPIQIVQHLEGGIVANILVAEGQNVVAGQVLVQLDGKQEMAALTEITARYVSLQLRRERLTAMVQNRAPNFDAVGAGYPRLIDDQQRTIVAQREQQASTMAVLTAQIAQRSQELSQQQQQLVTARQSLEIVTEQADVFQHAVAAGVASRQSYLQTSRALSSAKGDVTRLQVQIDINRSQLAEAQQRRDNVGHTQIQDAQNELANIGTEIEQVKTLVDKELDRIERLDIKAPVSGIVQDLRTHSIGEVLPAGGQVTRVVPVTDDLEAAIRISPTDIGYVRVGQPVRVKVATFDAHRYGLVKATLSSISAITFNDENGHPYYKGTIKLATSAIGTGEFASPLQPGMTIQADIVTGTRSMLQYLLQPGAGLARPSGPVQASDAS